jgi:hypothetical protein
MLSVTFPSRSRTHIVHAWQRRGQFPCWRSPSHHGGNSHDERTHESDLRFADGPRRWLQRTRYVKIGASVIFAAFGRRWRTRAVSEPSRSRDERIGVRPRLPIAVTAGVVHDRAHHPPSYPWSSTGHGVTSHREFFIAGLCGPPHAVSSRHGRLLREEAEVSRDASFSD